ncbi:MAG: sporulation protein YunB [Clostridia bacterium]|nr:sporulation protein YunB [Clostridia bacterium]
MKFLHISNIKKFFKKHKNHIIITFIIAICSTLLLFCFGIFISPILKNTIELRSKSLATTAMNSAISDVVMNSVVYDDLVNIVTDELGNITMIQANSLEINNLSKDLAQSTEKRITELGQSGIAIAVGSFTGIPLLVGVGPQIKLNVTPIGAVTCTFTSKFESAGINQTIHRIYVTINSRVGIVMPLYSRRYEAKQQVLICESIIVGQVPEVYLYSDQLDTLLNFVPY